MSVHKLKQCQSCLSSLYCTCGYSMSVVCILTLCHAFSCTGISCTVYMYSNYHAMIVSWQHNFTLLSNEKLIWGQCGIVLPGDNQGMAVALHVHYTWYTWHSTIWHTIGTCTSHFPLFLQVTLPVAITPRYGHSAVVFDSGASSRVVVLFGGNKTGFSSGIISETTLLLLGECTIICYWSVHTGFML